MQASNLDTPRIRLELSHNHFVILLVGNVLLFVSQSIFLFRSDIRILCIEFPFVGWTMLNSNSYWQILLIEFSNQNYVDKILSWTMLNYVDKILRLLAEISWFSGMIPRVSARKTRCVLRHLAATTFLEDLFFAWHFGGESKKKTNWQQLGMTNKKRIQTMWNQR